MNWTEVNGETNAVAFVTLTGKNEKNKSYVTASVSGRDISYVILKKELITDNKWHILYVEK